MKKGLIGIFTVVFVLVISFGVFAQVPIGAPEDLFDDYEMKSPDEIEEPIQIGYSPPTYDLSDMFGQFAVGLEEGLEARGIEYELTVNSPVDHTAHTEQRGIVDDLIVMDPDFILIAPTGYETQIPAYKEVNAAGIPFILVNYSEPLHHEDVKALTYAGYSHTVGGLQVGLHLADVLLPGDKVGYIAGDPGFVSNNRLEATVKAPLEAMGVETVHLGYGEWDRTKAYDIAEDILMANPDVDVIYAGSSAMAIGAVAAVESAGMEDQVDVYGWGGTIEEIDYLMQGRLAGVPFRDPITIGDHVAETIMLYMEGKLDEITYSYDVPMVMLLTEEDVEENVHPVTFESEGKEWPFD